MPTISKSTNPKYAGRVFLTDADLAARRQDVIDIIKDMTHDGAHRVGVRQVAYQYVVRGYSGGDKSEDTMKKVGEDLVRLRRGIEGLFQVPYGWIIDDTRRMRRPLVFENISERLEMAADNYRRALWSDTPDYVEVMLEKEGLAGIIEEETDPLDVPLFPVKGYNSLTGLYEAAERYKERARQNITVYTLGDFDPSGIDAVEVSEREIHRLAGPNVNITFTRLAMNAADLTRTEYAVAVRETKTSDTRAKKHITQYGEMSSLELDAMDPDELRRIVREAIEHHVDQVSLTELREAEERDRERLRAIAKREAENES